MIYCDTSVLVAALAAEANSTAVRAWLDEHSDQIAFSRWVGTELSNALAMKRRLGILDDDAWSRVMLAWRVLRDTQLMAISVIDDDFTVASDLIDRRDLIIRSGDALHLAIVMRLGFSLATLDRKFADAARTMAVKVSLELPRASP